MKLMVTLSSILLLSIATFAAPPKSVRQQLNEITACYTPSMHGPFESNGLFFGSGADFLLSLLSGEQFYSIRSHQAYVTKALPIFDGNEVIYFLSPPLDLNSDAPYAEGLMKKPNQTFSGHGVYRPLTPDFHDYAQIKPGDQIENGSSEMQNLIRAYGVEVTTQFERLGLKPVALRESWLKNLKNAICSCKHVISPAVIEAAKSRIIENPNFTYDSNMIKERELDCPALIM